MHCARVYTDFELLVKFASFVANFFVDDAASTASANSADLTAAFWDELVEATAKSWKEYDVRNFIYT